MNKTLLVSIIAILIIHARTAPGQGSLTPTGGPAPVMRTLIQVEPRVPISTLPGDAQATHIISVPGSYYLTENTSGNTAKMGIRVDAVGVTIDLNGFMLEGVAGSTLGIGVTASGGPVTIRNGNLRFWTTGGIVSFSGARVVVEDLDISSISAGPAIYLGNFSTASRIRVSGSQRYGIRMGVGSIASGCIVENFSGTNWNVVAGDTTPAGIKADTVSGCTVRGFSSAGGITEFTYGIFAELAEDCLVENLNFQGLDAAGISAQVIQGCHLIGLSSPGAGEFVFARGALVKDNVIVAEGADSLGVDGGGYKTRIEGNVLVRNQIRVYGNSDVVGNRVMVGTNNTAILVSGSANTIADNNIEAGNASARGIQVTGSGNIVRENNITIGTSSGRGILVDGSGNLIVRNSIRPGANSEGISITSGAHNRIDENMITGGSWGITIAGGAGGGTNNLVTRNFVGGPSNGYMVFGSGGQTAGLLIDDTIAGTNSAWINFGQP